MKLVKLVANLANLVNLAKLYGETYTRPIVPLKFGMGGGGGKPNNYSRFGKKNKSVGKVGRR